MTDETGVRASRTYTAHEQVCTFHGTDVAFTSLASAKTWCIDPYTKTIRAGGGTLSGVAQRIRDIPEIQLPCLATATRADLDACIAAYAADPAGEMANIEIGYGFVVTTRCDIAAGEELRRHYGREHWWLYVYHASTHPLIRLHCLYRLKLIYVCKGEVYTGCDSQDVSLMLSYLDPHPVRVRCPDQAEFAGQTGQTEHVRQTGQTEHVRQTGHAGEYTLVAGSSGWLEYLDSVGLAGYADSDKIKRLIAMLI